MKKIITAGREDDINEKMKVNFFFGVYKNQTDTPNEFPLYPEWNWQIK